MSSQETLYVVLYVPLMREAEYDLLKEVVATLLKAPYPGRLVECERGTDDSHENNAIWVKAGLSEHTKNKLEGALMLIYQKKFTITHSEEVLDPNVDDKIDRIVEQFI